jgi:hypothetical protein
MITNLTKEDLIAFEEDIANEFNTGNITIYNSILTRTQC